MKYEIGSQWKARGQWRAVIVEKRGATMTVWHDKTVSEAVVHDLDGVARCPNKDFSLTTPWKEPKIYEGWVNVYDLRNGIIVTSHVQPTKKDADDKARPRRTACIKVRFTEGDGLDATCKEIHG